MRTRIGVTQRVRGLQRACPAAPSLLVLALATVMAAVCARRAGGAPTLLTPERERITDQAIARDRAALDAVDRRLAAVDVTNLPPRAYTQALAQGWLAVAREQYALNDRSGLVEAAFQQAARLASVLESGGASLEPPLRTIPGVVRVREDLWQFGDSLGQSRALRCVAAELARLQIELVRAGHEATVRREDDPRPHAEGLDARAAAIRREAEDCGPVPRASRVALVPPAGQAIGGRSAGGAATAGPPPPSAASQQVQAALQELGALSTVHFNLNTNTISSISSQVLDSVAAVMRQVPEIRATLIGHTDPRGSAAFNLALGRRRALAVRDYLQAAGVDTARLTIATGGKSNPVARGSGILEDALNRRVEIQYTGPGNVRIESRRQEMDLQFQLENPTAPVVPGPPKRPTSTKPKAPRQKPSTTRP